MPAEKCQNGTRPKSVAATDVQHMIRMDYKKTTSVKFKICHQMTKWMKALDSMHITHLPAKSMPNLPTAPLQMWRNLSHDPRGAPQMLTL